MLLMIKGPMGCVVAPLEQVAVYSRSAPGRGPDDDGQLVVMTPQAEYVFEGQDCHQWADDICEWIKEALAEPGRRALVVDLGSDVPPHLQGEELDDRCYVHNPPTLHSAAKV